nr:hypothetical protein [uncultured Bacteroides sp.]
MSKIRKVTHTKREEQQANRVLKIIFVALVALALVMLIGFSLLD